MLKTTQLYSYHSLHSKLTGFAGYEMPLWYTTTTDEHMAVRSSSGIFDVSHMGRVLVKGESAPSFLEGLLPTKVQAQEVGRAFYTLLLNDRAGIIDDLIALRTGEKEFVLVVNAANREADISHMEQHALAGVEIVDLTDSSAMVAVQGPRAEEALQPLTPLDLHSLKRLRCAEAEVMGQRSIISRTGYTGEDGFEVVVLDSSVETPGKAIDIWAALAAVSKPCGLGARDSLRLEAGLPLHGTDMDQHTNPLQAGLGWVITAGKSDYVGSDSVSATRASGPDVVRRGVVIDEGIPRHGFQVLDGSGPLGLVTSGTFSPLLKKGIALCRLKPERTKPGAEVSVSVRDSTKTGRVVTTPFYDESHYGWKRANGN